MGWKFYYDFFDKQLRLTGTVFSPTKLGEAGQLLGGFDYDDSATILSPNGDPRSNGFMDNSLSLEYRPGFVEGLLFTASYLGMTDLGQGTYIPLRVGVVLHSIRCLISA